MDYEKMYKAVLKTATQWIKDGCSDKVKICLECIFPELRESEDERIRVRLIEYFKGFLEGYEDCYKDGGCIKWEGLDVKSILAFLEKQKKTADSFTDGIIEVRSFQRGIEEGRRLEKKKLDKMIVVSPEVWDNAISDAFENGKKEGEKQKEQKHPDGCFTCDEYKKGYEEGRRNGFTAGYNKAMKEVEQKEQKPTENEKVEITDFEQSVYDLCPVLGIEEAKATASDLLELAKKTLLKTGKVVLASNYPEGCSFEDGFHLGYNEGFNAKQKEQKPAEKQDYSGLSNLERVIHRGFLAADLEDVPVTIIKETAKECVAQMKPAEWDDYTKINLGRAIQIIKDARGTLHGYQTDDGIYECDKAIEALEHFLYRGLEIEKSAEWSEEDEKRFKRVLEIVDRHGTVPVFDGKVEKRFNAEYIWLKNLRERLKSFRPQSKQKQNDYITPHKEFFKFIYDRLINVHKENPNVDYMRSFKERLNNLSFGEKQEWSEEDENKIESIKGLITMGKFVDTNTIKTIWKLLDSLRPQPKVEWSEEECGRLFDIEHYLDGTLQLSPDRKIACIDFLKSLRPLPSWKPSEQEKGALRTAIHILTEERSFPKAAGHLQAILDAFDGKESRKNWKPSEAQLMALHSVIDDESDTIGNEQLKLLYGQLKKLM